MRNIDSRTRSLRFDCCVFLFHSFSAVTFATQSGAERTCGRDGRNDANDPGCVKTNTSAKCRKNNSPTRYRAESAQDDLAPLCAISPRVLLRARSALEFSHGQDPLQTWRLDSPTGNFGMSPAKVARTKICPTSSQALSESRREWLLLTRRTPRS